MDLEHVRDVVNPEMEALKRRYFGARPDEPIMLHRAELVNRKPPFEALRTPDAAAAFDDELLTFLRRWEYTVITVCLDKKKHQETYTVWRYAPYHYCLAVLLERFNFWRNPPTPRSENEAAEKGEGRWYGERIADCSYLRAVCCQPWQYCPWRPHGPWNLRFRFGQFQNGAATF